MTETAQTVATEVPASEPKAVVVDAEAGPEQTETAALSKPCVVAAADVEAEADDVKQSAEDSNALIDEEKANNALSSAVETGAQFTSVPESYAITDNLLGDEVYAVYNYIGGEYCVPASGEYIRNMNPATNQLIAKIANSTAPDIDAAVAAARKALPAWRALAAEKRGDYLRKIANGMARKLREFAQLESRDQGKPFFFASIVDVPGAIKIWKYYAEQSKYMVDDALVRDDTVSYVQRPPLGVVSGIVAWNYPLYLISNKIAPAIAYGNTIVVKPSEITPMTAYLLTTVIKAVGVPPGVINIVQGYGRDCGQAIVEHPAIRAISFTGGCKTGKRVAATASRTMKKQHLELGGKNPTIICPDVNIKKIVGTVAMSAFGNTGQICICGSRIFVHRAIAAEFTEALCAQVQSNFTAKIGNPASSLYGPLVSLAQRQRVEGYVKLALEEGGKILMGGKRPALEAPFDEGAFYEPTVVTGLSWQSRCATEEIFGPVVTIHEWESEAEVIEMANCTNYGLAGSVWTNDIKRGHRMAAQIESGSVWVNCWAASSHNIMPFGGFKNSGNGRENGLWSRDFYTECKNIVIQL